MNNHDEVVPSGLGKKKIDFNTVTDDQAPLESTQETTLSEKQRRELDAFIEIFDERLATQLYSKSFEKRFTGLQSLATRLKNNEKNCAGDMTAVGRACLPVNTKLFKDKVQKVYEANAAVFLFLLEKHDKSSEISFLIDKSIPLILPVTGDSNSKLRASAQNFIVKMDRITIQKGIVPQHVFVPFNYKKKMEMYFKSKK